MMWKDYRMCFRKRRFRSAEHARRTARRWEQRIYFCPVCNGWHCATDRVRAG
jgi:hypothetical protein